MVRVAVVLRDTSYEINLDPDVDLEDLSSGPAAGYCAS